MTDMELKKLLKSTVVMVKAEVIANSVLQTMAMRQDMNLAASELIYDLETDRYYHTGGRMTLQVYPDRYLGCFSDDGRIEMFTARVKQINKYGKTLLPIEVGTRVYICFDSLLEAGCIRSAENGGNMTELAMLGYLKDYDFEGDPVEPMPSATLSEALECLGIDRFDSEGEGSAASEQPGQSQQTFATGAPDNGTLSKDEIDHLLSGLDEEESAGQASGKAEGGEGASDASGGSDEGEGY